MIPVIISGGSGTRLWPVSRTSFPKQFLDIFEETLFSKTILRLKQLGEPWCVTLASMKHFTESEFRSHGLSIENIVYEPMACNTAPAIALLCHRLSQRGKKSEVVGVFPADHWIENEATFISAVRLAEKVAGTGQIVTLGISPSHPSTGFGYIEVGSNSVMNHESLKALTAKGFREKPAFDVAQEYIQSGNFYWNAGMFVFKVSVMVELFQTHMPWLWKEIEKIDSVAVGDLRSQEDHLQAVYQKLEKQSFDIGIMEKLNSHVCVPCSMGWSDIGSWDEVSRLIPGAPVTETQACGNFVVDAATPRGALKSKKYVFVGVNDLILVDTTDACLVVRKGESQMIKNSVEQIREACPELIEQHSFEVRPWGRFEILRDSSHFKSKLIQVLPGQQLSYQSHQKRAEHWVIVAGEAEVILDDVVHRRISGESIYIPQGAKHRIRNAGQSNLEFVEIQIGSYFGEDDIRRFSDDYGRR